MSKEIINEYNKEIIKNIFKKINDKEMYVILELVNRLQDNINKIDKAIEYINENTYLGDGEYTNHCDMLSRNELLEILGDKENE